MDKDYTQKVTNLLDKAVTALQQQDRELAYLRAELFKLRLQVTELTDKNKMVR